MPHKEKIIYVTAFPDAIQTGVLSVPSHLTDDEVREYIIDNWNDISFERPTLDYENLDFEWDRDA